MRYLCIRNQRYFALFGCKARNTNYILILKRNKIYRWSPNLVYNCNLSLLLEILWKCIDALEMIQTKSSNQWHLSSLQNIFYLWYKSEVFRTLCLQNTKYQIIMHYMLHILRCHVDIKICHKCENTLLWKDQWKKYLWWLTNDINHIYLLSRYILFMAKISGISHSLFAEHEIPKRKYQFLNV